MTPGPLSSVLAAVEGGASTLVEVGRVTGLGADVVSAAVDHLARAGRLRLLVPDNACPPAGCGGCASATLHGNLGCRQG